MKIDDPKRWIGFIKHSLPGSKRIKFQALGGDGSSRRFYRIKGTPVPAVLMVNPDPPADKRTGVNENDTFVYVSGLLAQAGGAPPLIYGYEREEGVVLMEDVGDSHLQDEVLAHGTDSRWTVQAYGRLVELLVVLQVDCGARFDPSRTFNPRYDSAFMYQAEGLYFADHFVEGLCKLKEGTLRSDLEALAASAGSLIHRELFLYRDFQSRNIMLEAGGGFRLLDFQGARLGPPAYDVASLLYDPYVALPDSLRQELIAHYEKCLEVRLPRAGGEFARQFPFIAAHRLMQVLGAYAKLALCDGKTEFLQYVPPALRDLKKLLEHEVFSGYRALGRVVGSLDPEDLAKECFGHREKNLN